MTTPEVPTEHDDQLPEQPPVAKKPDLVRQPSSSEEYAMQIVLGSMRPKAESEEQ
jgi:hypothetical protein